MLTVAIPEPSVARIGRRGHWPGTYSDVVSPRHSAGPLPVPPARSAARRIARPAAGQTRTYSGRRARGPSQKRASPSGTASPPVRVEAPRPCVLRGAPARRRPIVESGGGNRRKKPRCRAGILRENFCGTNERRVPQVRSRSEAERHYSGSPSALSSPSDNTSAFTPSRYSMAAARSSGRSGSSKTTSLMAPSARVSGPSR